MKQMALFCVPMLSLIEIACSNGGSTMPADSVEDSSRVIQRKVIDVETLKAPDTVLETIGYDKIISQMMYDMVYM